MNFNKTLILHALFLLSSHCLNAQWEKMGSLYGGTFHVSSDSNRLVAFSLYGTNYVTAVSLDTGKTWTHMTKPTGSLGYIFEYYVQGTKIFAMHRNSVVVSKDDGKSWTEIPRPHPNNKNTQMVADGNNMYLLAGVDTFFVYKFEDSTNTWVNQSFFPENTVGITFTSTKIYALTPNGFYTTNKQTINWVKYNAPFVPDLNEEIEVAKLSASGEAVCAINHLGDAFASKDAGKTWKKIVLNDTRFNQVALFKNGKVFLKRSGGVWVSNDTMTTWQQLDKGWVNSYRYRRYKNGLTLMGNTLIANTESSQSTDFSIANGMMKMDITEQEWQYLPTSPIAHLNITNLNRSGNAIIAATKEGLLYKSTNSGKTWTPMPIPPLKVQLGFPNSRDLITKDSFILFHGALDIPPNFGLQTTSVVWSSDYGKTWQNPSSMNPFGSHFFQGDTLYISQPGGTYASLPPYTSSYWVAPSDFRPHFVVKDQYIVGYNWRYDILITNKTGQILVPSALNVDYIRDMIVHNDHIIMMRYDSIYISANNGFNWRSKKVTGANFLAYMASFNNTLLVVDNNNKAFASNDNGETWVAFKSGLPSEVNGHDNGESGHLVDSNYVYIMFRDIGIFRRSIADFKVSSIAGKVFNDKNNNGIQEIGEEPLKNVLIKTSSSKVYTVSDSLGNYYLQAELTKDDTVRVVLPSLFATSKPDFYILQDRDSSKNFGIHFLTDIKDLSVTATAVGPTRPGFNNTLVLTAENKGTVTQNATVTLAYDNRVQYQFATPTPSSNTPQYLTWNFPNFLPFDKKDIKIELKTQTTVPLSTKLTHVAQILPITNDTMIQDNTDSLRIIVVGSYDPNDKSVNQKDVDVKQLSNPLPLVYTIRFQNTGTFPATFVRVVDTLSQNLDIASLKVLSSSHLMTYKVKGKGIIEFFFDNINLPDSVSNEKASHGFVKYSIKPLNSLKLKDAVKNTAYIYFDFNTPIKTNTTENLVVTLTNLKNVVDIPTITLAPNPTSSEFYFQLPDEAISHSDLLHLSLIKPTGETVLRQSKHAEVINSIDVSTLSSGLYILKIQLGNQTYVGKIFITR